MISLIAGFLSLLVMTIPEQNWYWYINADFAWEQIIGINDSECQYFTKA